ncbi:MAG: hypothetical protein E6532_10400 [Bifidobacterium longum]|nr:hypothetical protein [Bifidobacterium longum]
MGKGKLSVLLHKTKISMRKSICLAIILAVFCMEEVPAQKIAKTKENPAVKAYSDSLSALSASYFAYFRLWDDLNIPAPRRVRPNPAFYKLFVPPTYYEAPIKEIFEIKWSPDTLHLQLYINCPIWKPWPLPTVGRIIY